MNEQVFISHSSKDRAWADRFLEFLEKNGIRCWIDKQGIRTGAKYYRAIDAAIKQCPVFLLVLSENAERSIYVPKEVEIAVSEDKIIIPIKIRKFEVEEFAFHLSNVQILDMTQGWDQQKMTGLARDIKEALASLPPAPAGQPVPPVPVDPGPSRTQARDQVGPPFDWKKLIVGACVLAAVFVLSLGVRQALGSILSSFGGQGQEDRAEVPSDVPSEVVDDAASEALEPAPSPVPATDKPTKLTKLHMMESEYTDVREDVTNSVGQTFDEAVYLCAQAFGRPYVSYYLGGEYSLFTGTVSCPDSVGSGYTYKLQVFLDGDEDEPALEMEMGRSIPPTPLSIDVSGCQTITFNIDTGGSVGAMIPDGLLYGKDADLSAVQTAAAPQASPEAAPEKKPMKLTKLHMMESEYTDLREDVVNSVGQTFDEAVYLCAQAFGRPYVSYYLGGEYSLFTGTVSCPDSVGSGHTYKFQIFLDGDEDEPALEMEMGRATPPTPLELDVSGCQTITFNIDTGGSVGAMIPDGLLTP